MMPVDEKKRKRGPNSAIWEGEEDVQERSAR